MTDSNKPGVWRENGDEMIDVKMVAAMCRVSTWHIYKMANSGRIVIVCRRRSGLDGCCVGNVEPLRFGSKPDARASGRSGGMSDKAINSADMPQLLNYHKAAALCGIRKTLWYSLNSTGRIPAPIKLGHRVLWSRSELEGWIAAGCPPRKTWEKMKINDG